MTSPLVPIREHFDQPRLTSHVWTLAKDGRTTRCELWTHILGFELRLDVPGDSLPRTHVCRTQDELVSTQERWRAALESKGWMKSEAGSGQR